MSKFTDEELQEFLDKYPVPQEPVIPAEIKFPFLAVFYRKKPSDRNRNYLMAVAVFGLADYCINKRSLKHKGWSIQTLMFNLPDFMLDDHEHNRYLYYKFQNWDELSTILSESDKLLVEDLKKEFPCEIILLKNKVGQYKIVI